MKRRYLIVAGSLAALACLTLGVLAMMPARAGVTKANFDRIEKGMTLAEVEEILGHHSTDFVIATDGIDIRFTSWRNSDGSCAQVTIVNYQVTDMSWGYSAESTAERIRRWLRLPWW